MKAPKNILVPTDFSVIARNALAQAIHLAKKVNGRLVIYHAYSRPTTEVDNTAALTFLRLSIDDKFKNLLGDLPELEEVPYCFKKDLGISVDSIVKTIDRESIDMVVMATEGATSFDELWGTKTAKIIKQAAVPLFVIPKHSNMTNIGKACLACDYSTETDYHEIEFLVELVGSMDLTIDVVTLNRTEKNMTRQELGYRDLLIKKFNKVKSSFSYTQSKNVEEGIIAYSNANNIGLIAILPKSYSFIERLFHESLTQKMAFHSPIPLLVLK